MDEKLEVMNTEGLTEVSAMDSFKAAVGKAAPFVGGVAVGAIGGYLISRFVVKPIIAKVKAKKTAQAVPAEAPKAEEKAPEKEA